MKSYTAKDITKHPFELIFAEDNPKFLVIGSFPTTDLKMSFKFFYPNANNKFWKVLSEVFAESKTKLTLKVSVNDTTETKEQNKTDRQNFCRENKIAMTDMLASCIRLNGKTLALVNGLLEVEEKYAAETDATILLVNNIIKSIDDIKDETFQKNFHKGLIEFYKGEPTDIEVLKEINIPLAKSVIIISEGKDRKADEKVLLTAYAISNYCKEIRHTLSDTIYIVAEVSDPSFTKSLEMADVSVVISSGELINNIIIQDAVCRGIYNPIKDLLHYSNDSNDFFYVAVSDYPGKLLGHTFDELSVLLRSQRLQLIGFKKNFFNGNEVIIDKEEIRERASKKNLPSEFIINPQTKDGMEERTEIGDEIIILAFSRKDHQRISNLKW